MKQAIRDVSAWMEGIQQAGIDEKDPHRKKILENYLQHVALEFNGRWPEFLGPDMTVDRPLYRVNMGLTPETDQVVVCDGYNAVLGFYMALNEETVLTNQDERLAVSDWGLASYNTINMWTRGQHLASIGVELADSEPESYYRVSFPIVMFWNYTSDAMLIGEEVFRVGAVKIEKINEAEWPSWTEVRDVAAKFLPPAALRTKAA
jgi:hypothetical protein